MCILLNNDFNWRKVFIIGNEVHTNLIYTIACVFLS